MFDDCDCAGEHTRHTAGVYQAYSQQGKSCDPNLLKILFFAFHDL
jgi:hypothetical protein